MCKGKIARWLEGIRPPDEDDEEMTAWSGLPPADDPIFNVQGDPRLADYEVYFERLAGKNVIVDETGADIGEQNRRLCERLLTEAQDPPRNSEEFDDDRLEKTCARAATNNKDMRLLGRCICPSPLPSWYPRGEETAMIRVLDVHPWNQELAILGLAPTPDYAAGFYMTTFNAGETSKMVLYMRRPQGLWFGERGVYFPFLTCEAKRSREENLEHADGVNAHSTAIAVRSVVQLLRATMREDELDGKILAFSLSYDAANVRIYAYYPEFRGATMRVRRHCIRRFNFAQDNGRLRWLASTFVMNVYHKWVPGHLEMIRAAVQGIPEPGAVWDP